MADSNSSLSSLSSNPLPVMASPTLPAFTAAGNTSSPAPIHYSGITPTSLAALPSQPVFPTILIGSMPVSTAPISPIFSAGEIYIPPNAAEITPLATPATVGDLQLPQPTLNATTPAVDTQPNNGRDVSPVANSELSNAALAQAMAKIAESMAQMQGAITTLIQNQNAAQIATSPLPLSTAMFLSHGLAHPPPNPPMPIPPLYAPHHLHGAILGSAPPFSMPAAMASAYRPISSSTPPSFPPTMANPTPIPTPEPRQTEAFIQSPRTRNVAFVDELLQENLRNNIETRLKTRIASLQAAEGQRLARIEETLKAMRGDNIYTVEDADFHVPQFRAPHKYKTPDFEKFTGEGCPRTHLRQFLHKMSIYAPDDFLLIHSFSESLMGTACQWFQHFDTHQYSTFKDLAVAFMNHYSVNMKLAPTVSDLRRMTRRGHETLRQFALRFRDEAQLIRPPLKERELVNEFIDLLPRNFLPYMVGQR